MRHNALLMHDDPRYKKTLEFRHAGRTLNFDVAQDLFSSQAVDVGTLQLLRSLDAPEHAARLRVLDVGCGYGPLGIALKAQNPDRIVHMVDRDALAVAYAEANAAQNAMSEGVSAYGSLGFDDVRSADPEHAGFDLIVSNIPGKAGEPVIQRLLLDARHHMAPGGLFAIVIVAPLADLVRSTLSSHDDARIVFERSGNRYAVFHYELEATEPSVAQKAFDARVYTRTVAHAQHKQLSWMLQTVHGLAEFNGPSYHTALAVDAVAKLARSPLRQVLVLNPGQGHLCTAMAMIASPELIELVGRDLLSLRISATNLERYEVRPEAIGLHHATVVSAEGPPIGTAVLLYPNTEPTPAVLADLGAAAARVDADGAVIVAGTSTLVSRVLDALGASGLSLRAGQRTKAKGHSAVTLLRKG